MKSQPALVLYAIVALDEAHMSMQEHVNLLQKARSNLRIFWQLTLLEKSNFSTNRSHVELFSYLLIKKAYQDFLFRH